MSGKSAVLSPAACGQNPVQVRNVIKLRKIITTTKVVVCTAPKRGEYRLTH